MKTSGRSILYLDEVNFTKLAIQSKDWSNKNTNLTVDQKEIYTGYRSVIVAMSEENGLENSLICRSAIDSESFVLFLQRLR